MGTRSAATSAATSVSTRLALLGPTPKTEANRKVWPDGREVEEDEGDCGIWVMNDDGGEITLYF